MKTMPLLPLVLLLLVSTAAAEPRISILPDPVDRGQAGRVILSGLAGEAPASGSFDGRPIFFFPYGEDQMGFFGADILLSPGIYPLTVAWPGGQKTLAVAVRDHQYGLRSIKAPKKQVVLSPEDQALAAREKVLTTQALAAKSPERLWSGPFLEPVAGPVNSSFGRQTKINGVLSPTPHAGADFSVPEGSPVKAPADGVVVLTGFHFFAGGSVYIDHGQGLVSMFFHLSDFKVKEGDRVSRGDLIALSGKTGRVTGAHLHYGLYLCQARIDPMAFQKLTTLLP